MGRQDRVVGTIALEDEVRRESREAVKALPALGVRVVMITGDARQVADAVAAELGIDEVFAEVLPEAKDHAVVEPQPRGDAAGVLTPVGVALAPAVGAILMSTSTIIVALNSQLLRRLELRPDPPRVRAHAAGLGAGR